MILSNGLLQLLLRILSSTSFSSATASASSLEPVWFALQIVLLLLKLRGFPCLFNRAKLLSLLLVIFLALRASTGTRTGVGLPGETHGLNYPFGFYESFVVF